VKSDSLTLVTKVNPVYPADAKKNKSPDLWFWRQHRQRRNRREASRGQRAVALQRAALEAVKQWRYQPFLLNGNPIVVKSNITVTFTLAE